MNLRDSFIRDYDAKSGHLAAPTAEEVESRLEFLALLAAERGVPFEGGTIGESTDGRPIFGMLIGGGPLKISLTGGAHSDEPGGPLAALTLAAWLLRQDKLLAETSWRICPHVNPDGAAVNAKWFAEPPHIEDYVRNVHRDLPGEDVEFNYPAPSPSTKEPREENLAVADFLRDGAPYDLHVSLHGMGFAEGAWWLIGEDWVPRTGQLRDALREHFATLDIGVHDIDRKGDKGFTRIERGFSTTPTSIAMRAFFEREKDPDTANLFLPSSMEFVQSLGNDPLVMVSEIPIFRLHGGGEISDPPDDNTPFQRFRPRLRALKAKPEAQAAEELKALIAEFDIRPVPFHTQIEAIAGGVLLAVEFLLNERES